MSRQEKRRERRAQTSRVALDIEVKHLPLSFYVSDETVAGLPPAQLAELAASVFSGKSTWLMSESARACLRRASVPAFIDDPFHDDSDDFDPAWSGR